MAQSTTILHRALSTRRPAHTASEAGFTASIIEHLARAASVYPAMVDQAGNLHYCTDPTARTLFAAHLDTAHWCDGTAPNAPRYTTAKNRTTTSIDRATTAHGTDAPLGADDGAGIHVLAALLTARTPGHYIFTRGEEIGGHGAKYIAENFPDLLARFDRAICFDRRGTDEIITHQGGKQCASQVFALALAHALADTEGLLYAPSPDGSYTDCKDWAHIIPECVNIACGYYHEHSPAESLDLAHLHLLTHAALTLDWEALPTKRNPAAHLPSRRKPRSIVEYLMGTDEDDDETSDIYRFY